MKQGKHTSEKLHLFIKETNKQKIFWGAYCVLGTVIGTVYIAINSNIFTMLKSLPACRGD